MTWNTAIDKGIWHKGKNDLKREKFESFFPFWKQTLIHFAWPEGPLMDLLLVY
jgi:hypothetical protein